MSILQSFGDFPQSAAEFYELSKINNQGEITDVWTKVATCNVWRYITSSIQNTKQNQFVNDKVVNIIYNPADIVLESGESLSLTKTLKIVINSVEYFTEGPDDINGFNEVVVLSCRRELV